MLGGIIAFWIGAILIFLEIILHSFLWWLLWKFFITKITRQVGCCQHHLIHYKDISYGKALLLLTQERLLILQHLFHVKLIYLQEHPLMSKNHIICNNMFRLCSANQLNVCRRIWMGCFLSCVLLYMDLNYILIFQHLQHIIVIGDIHKLNL